MDKDNIFKATETPEMIDAFKQARSTFKYFWRELWWERRRIVPALNLPVLKQRFVRRILPELLLWSLCG